LNTRVRGCSSSSSGSGSDSSSRDSKRTSPAPQGGCRLDQDLN
jgi:hypothetical protein